MNKDYPFRMIEASRIIKEDEVGFIIRDGYPFSLGHFKEKWFSTGAQAHAPRIGVAPYCLA